MKKKLCLTELAKVSCNRAHLGRTRSASQVLIGFSRFLIIRRLTIALAAKKGADPLGSAPMREPVGSSPGLSGSL